MTGHGPRLAWSGVAQAGSGAGLEDALAKADALEDGDPRRVREVLAPYAGSDRAEVASHLAPGAAYDLGRAYEHGVVGPVDLDVALEWFAERRIHDGGPTGRQ